MRIGTASLVHDVRKRRVEVLGAEINRQGDVLPQKDRLADFTARLRHRMAHLADPDEVIVGVSNYDRRFTERGRYRFDGEDVQRMLDQFENHWDQLNRRFTQDFLDALHREFAIDLRQPSLGLKTTWVAWLPTGRRFVYARPGGQHAEEAVKRLRLASGSRLLSTIGNLYSTVALDGHPALGDQDRGPLRDDGWDEAHELEDLLEALWPHDSPEQPGHTDEDEDADSMCRQGTRGRQSLDDQEVLTTGDLGGTDGREETSDGSSLHRKDEVVDGNHSFHSSESEAPERAEDYDGATMDDLRTIISGSPASSPWALPRRVVRLRTATTKRGGVPTTTVSIDSGGGHQHERRFDGLRHAAAVIEVLLDELLAARRDGVEMLIASVGSNWLAKALVQRTSSFRQAPLFSRVLRLHELVRGTGIELVVGGRSA